MYLNLDSFKKAYDKCVTHVNKGIDNGFFGLLFILKNVGKNQKIIPLSKLAFSSADVSKQLSKIFSFEDIHTKNNVDNLILSNQYIQKVKDIFLHGEKVDALSIAIICLHDFNFSKQLNEKELVSFFKEEFMLSDEHMENWFDNDHLYEIDFDEKESSNSKKEFITHNFSNKNAINFSKPHEVIQKSAGDWGASGYLQKFKPTTSAGDFAAVIHSTLINEYINSIEQPLSNYNNYQQNDIKGENIIYYGAPGTGKSYIIDRVANPQNSVRTVFHPETQHIDFVGSLKPLVKNNQITYDFRPGPFSLAIIMAIKNKEIPVYLIIEEINRANAAAVFGEIFVLLDRQNGRSRYNINLSDLDMKAFLELHAKDAFEDGRLFLPSNLFILATMNSSDQAVLPMDAAFKRRWTFEYISLYGNSYPYGNLKIPLTDKIINITWKDFSIIINKKLSQLMIPEDRLLGPWFLSESDLKNDETALKALSSKVLMYLWDDILRHGKKETIFLKQEINTLGQLIERLNTGSQIFNDDVESELRDKSIIL
ncbi:TPA: AAA domain-containing protein [Legionella pneumophila]|uniref:AAA family ATPase n=1 Tax=Legionella pneumophila TaxID=446 RepID=UPI00067D0715|nr:AAA family ATPase [Legionella pneumophila]HAT2150917.1 AAA domain-containing protein [Legionella pneumophila]